jgi:hypothetical protein
MTTLYQPELTRWAVGVLYLNLGMAVVEFPTVTKAHPSYWVHVGLSPKGSLDSGHRGMFPFQVRWDLWQRVISPLFATGEALIKVGAEQNETLRQWINRESLRTRDHSLLILKIERLLLANLEAAGYLPAGTVESV